ncbi:MAG: hypothetical protein RIS64_3606 [Bacteroidota bacterium]|jgi:hypothetical protein
MNKVTKFKIENLSLTVNAGDVLEGVMQAMQAQVSKCAENQSDNAEMPNQSHRLVDIGTRKVMLPSDLAQMIDDLFADNQEKDAAIENLNKQLKDATGDDRSRKITMTAIDEKRFALPSEVTSHIDALSNGNQMMRSRISQLLATGAEYKKEATVKAFA